MFEILHVVPKISDVIDYIVKRLAMSMSQGWRKWLFRQLLRPKCVYAVNEGNQQPVVMVIEQQ